MDAVQTRITSNRFRPRPNAPRELFVPAACALNRSRWATPTPNRRMAACLRDMENHPSATSPNAVFTGDASVLVKTAASTAMRETYLALASPALQLLKVSAK